MTHTIPTPLEPTPAAPASVAGARDASQPLETASGSGSLSWIAKGFLGAVILAAAIAISPSLADPDLWGHVQYGLDALAEGLPSTTTYSFTADGYFWINHENLAELLLATLATTVGPQGMLVFKTLLGMMVILLMLREGFRNRAGVVAVALMALLVATNLSYHWSMRPQIISYSLYALMLTLLAWSFRGWSGQWHLWAWVRDPNRVAPSSETAPAALPKEHLWLLWFAVPLFFVWTNSHGGFVAGYCLFLAYLGLRGFEAWSVEGPRSRDTLARFAAVAVASGGVTLINPYGVGLHLWLVRSLGQPRPEITEWHAPNMLDSLAIPLWFLLAAVLLTLLLTRRQRDFTETIVLLLVCWQALEHQRHIPFLAIAAGFWLTRHLQSLLERCHLGQGELKLGDDLSPRARKALLAGLACVYALLGWRLVGRWSDMPVLRSEFPVSAVQYLADRQLETGNLVVTYNWAQYAIAALGTTPERMGRGLRVAFDGRFRTCYPQEIVDMHFDFILGNGGPEMRSRGANSPSFDPYRVLEYGQPDYGQPDLVLINRFQPHGELVMNQRRGEWALLYQDRIAQVWGRRARFDNPRNPDYIPENQRVIGDAPQEGSLTWPALPEPPQDAAAAQLASRS